MSECLARADNVAAMLCHSCSEVLQGGLLIMMITMIIYDKS